MNILEEGLRCVSAMASEDFEQSNLTVDVVRRQFWCLASEHAERCTGFINNSSAEWESMFGGEENGTRPLNKKIKVSKGLFDSEDWILCLFFLDPSTDVAGSSGCCKPHIEQLMSLLSAHLNVSNDCQVTFSYRWSLGIEREYRELRTRTNHKCDRNHRNQQWILQHPVRNSTWSSQTTPMSNNQANQTKPQIESKDDRWWWEWLQKQWNRFVQSEYWFNSQQSSSGSPVGPLWVYHSTLLLTGRTLATSQCGASIQPRSGAGKATAHISSLLQSDDQTHIWQV